MQHGSDTWEAGKNDSNQSMDTHATYASHKMELIAVHQIKNRIVDV